MSTNKPTPTLVHLLVALLFVALLLVPVAYGVSSRYVDKSKLAGVLKGPGFQKEALLEPDYYKAWYRYTGGLIQTLAPLSRAKNWIDYHLFAMTDAAGVHVGRQGWLFDDDAVQSYHKNDCDEAAQITRQIMTIRSAARLADLAGRRFIFSVIPNKSTIYPEYVGPVPQNQPCSKSLYDIFLSIDQIHPIEAFVRLDGPLIRAKSPERPLYDATGRHWNAAGAQIATQTLLNALFGNAPQGQRADVDDLSRVLMEPAPETVAGHGHTAGPDGKKHYSACILYGGPATTFMLPSLMPRFDRVDVIDSPHIPSQNHNENIAAYETIIALINESDLATMHFDMDRFCLMLGADASAGARHVIDLKSIRAKSGSALGMDDSRLVIKSMGATAFIEMPALPGSDSHSLRILKIDLTAPRRGTLTWAVDGDENLRNMRQLRSGLNQLYLPLPARKSVRLLINTGQTAGIFHLERAELLSYGDAAALMLPQPGPTQPMDDDTGLGQVDRPGSGDAQTMESDVPPTIVMNDIEAGRIFQRRGTTCDVFISGSYRGRAMAIEAAVLKHDDDTVVVPWTTVDATPANGIFMGVLPNVPQGGWYRLATRFSTQPEVGDRGNSPWGVGLLAACIGQSNIREWFHTGSDLSPNDLVSIHRNGRWSPAESLGNGAVAFANRLITRLGIPVGLLDYAVNGSGLCREADWGKGYWADRSPQSIYRQFIEGITAAGGAIEYVIWMQGEADAARKTITANQYRKTLNNFITRQVRVDIVNGSPREHLPFLVIGMVKRPVGQDEPHQAIRNALVAVSRETADCYLAATTLDLKNMGRQHLTPHSYTRLGRRTAQTVLHLLGKADYYRGPQIIHVEKRDDTTIELRMVHRGGDDFTPTRGITGFMALTGNRAVPIVSVHRAAADTLQVRLGRPAAAPLRLTYLYGAMPDDRHPVRDNSALQLPLEPFETLLE